LVSLLSLLVFLVPSNLFLVLHHQIGYAAGMRIDYLIPKLYLSDLVAGAFATLTLAQYRPRVSKWLIYIGISWFILLLRQVATLTPASSLWFFAELSLAGVVIWSLVQLPKRIREHTGVTWSLASMLGLQSLVAIGQFALQKSLFGYWFLGETNLLHFAGIASQTIGGQEFILPSGTTPHPNVLAGVLLIGSVVLWQRRKDIPRWLLLSTLAVSLFGIGVTFSLSAWLAGMFALGFYGVKSQLDTTHKRIVLAGVWSLIVLIPLVMSQFSVVSANPSLTRRSTLNQVAITTFAAQPLWGTGLNTFTRGLALTNTHRILERFVQPAHHVPLLLLAETGLFGVLAGVGILIWLRKNSSNLDAILLASCVLVPLISLDHYLYTLESGRLAVVVLLLMVLAEE